MTTRAIACAFCMHFKPEIRSENTCSAFPNGIPNLITLGLNDHTDPWPGDNGLRFEPLPGFEHALHGWNPIPETGKLKRQIPWARPKR